MQDMACVWLCGVVDCWLEKSGEDSEGMGMDRFQLTVRREELSRSNVALCPCPVDCRGTGVISLGDSGEGLEERSIPGLRGALLPRDWCLISYQTS